MASLEGKLAQFGDNVVFREAYDYFQALNAKLRESTTKELVLQPSYLSKFEVVDDLRKKLRDEFKTAAPPGVESFDAALSPLLDPAKEMLEIAQGSDYSKLETYINDCVTKAKGAFDPPLAVPFKSAASGSAAPANVYSVPNTTDLDPRRHGRIIMIEEYDGAIKKWLQNNALLYGLTFYGNVGLYYIGFKQTKEQATSTTAIINLVNRFQQTAIPASAIQLKSSAIQAAKDPVSGDLDPIRLGGSSVQDNNGKAFSILYRINKQSGTKETITAFQRMNVAAKAAGVTLTCNSGFRPAAGPSVKWVSDSGVNGKFTTQESLRRDPGRWKDGSTYKNSKGKTVTKPLHPHWTKYVTNNGSVGASGLFGPKSGKEAFIWYATSGAFIAATAPPGRSNHGSGISLDFNTGSRTGFGGSLNVAVYKWLAFNAHKFGFIRTVNSEEWHFEYRPQMALKGPKAKCTKLWYSDLGLDNIPI